MAFSKKKLQQIIKRLESDFTINIDISSSAKHDGILINKIHWSY